MIELITTQYKSNDNVNPELINNIIQQHHIINHPSIYNIHTSITLLRRGTEQDDEWFSLLNLIKWTQDI